MNSRERVIATIEGKPRDRMPIYGWLFANLAGEIGEAYGSVASFEDRYEFDYAHLFGGPKPYPDEALKALADEGEGAITPASLLSLEMSDPDDEAAYGGVKNGIAHHKESRSRFVYAQTPGIFECLNRPFGIENHLLYLAMYEDELHEVYRRQAEWNRRFAMNCLDLGVDMIHVSDDWGAQAGLMFSPERWRRLIFPYHKVTCEAVHDRGGYLSLHTDGNVTQVLDGIVELGYDVVHPYQESAGMDYGLYLQQYRSDFVIMGGLDIQTTLGRGEFERLEREIRRVVELFRDGGMLLCTTHFVQDHCTIEELAFAYDLVSDLVRREPG